MTLLSIHPYYKVNFLEFFGVLIPRLWLLITGQLSTTELAPDEVQLLVLAPVAASAALVGVFLMLRRMTMLANSLSHTILLGIVIAFLLTRSSWEAQEHHGIHLEAMLIAALLTGVATTFLTEFLTRTFNLQEDASTGLVFSSLFAIGLVLVTLFTRNVHIGAEVIMGNVDALHHSDIWLSLTVFAVNTLLILVFYKEYKLTAFDQNLARALGFSVVFFNYMLMVQVSATAVAAFRAVGVLMVLALITAPPLTARLLTHRLHTLLFLAVSLGALGSLIGVATARHLLSVHRLALSTAGVVVCTLVVQYLVVLLLAPEQGIIARLLRRRKLQRLNT